MTIAPPFNLKLTDAHSKGEWLFKLVQPPSVSWLTQDQFSVVLSSEGRMIGDFDEQRTWHGGRGGDRFSEDETKYRDAKEAMTQFEGFLFPSLQWRFSEGYRGGEQDLHGSMSWRGLFGTTRYISRSFTVAPALTADKAQLWIKKVGTPGTLTFELTSNSSGDPGTVLKTATKTASDVTDVLSVLMEFDWTGTESLSNSTVYHVKVYGASTDNEFNHWEVGVDVSGSSSKYSSNGSSWTTAAFSMYYRVVDADISRRWWYFYQGANFCKVSNESTTKLYKWNESTDLWEEVTGHGLTGVTGKPIEVNGFVYFPRGDATAIRVWDGTNWDDQTVGSGQGAATGLVKGYSFAENVAQIWRFNNSDVSGASTTGLAKSVSRANAVSTYTTDLSFGNSIRIGDKSTNINSLLPDNNRIWVFKTNEVGVVENDRYTEMGFGIRKTPSSNNGIASVTWNGSVYFNWLFSDMRVFSGQVDDVGQGFNASFPDGREGVSAAYTTYISWMFIAKDADTGTSSVLVYDGLNLHEFLRGWSAGKRIREVEIQTVSGGRNRLWVDCGGDSLYVELPLNKANPLDDPDMKYMHEAVLESSLIDMGTASKLPKHINEVTLTSKHLDGAGKVVKLDYQVDDQIRESWTTDAVLNAGKFSQSPEDTVKISESNITQFAYRLRMETDDQLVPPIIRGVVPNGFARSPTRRIFSFTVESKNATYNGHIQKARDVIEWIEEASESAYPIILESNYDLLDGYRVVVAPPNILGLSAEPERNVLSFTCMVMK